MLRRLVRSNISTRFTPSLLSTLSRSVTTDTPNSTKSKKGLLQNILYGDESSKEEIQAAVESREVSYSQKIARGKYIHEIIKHKVKPDRVAEYINLIKDVYPKLAANPIHEVNLVCSLQNLVGETWSFTHIWEYKGYSGYDRTTEFARNAPFYKSYREKLHPLINTQVNSLNQEFAFWNTLPPQTLGGIFELRTYTLQPGALLEWETHWRTGLLARRQVMNPVGAWFSQMGQLNQVTHIWQFDSFAARKAARERCWEIDGWADTVHKTVPLIVDMKSEMLKALDFSPIR